jgi:hypothetical protein
MQTFLPYPSFRDSAASLDYKRLGNQRNEAMVIWKTIHGHHDAWKHHPCSRMWGPYPDALADYFNAICREWESRGYTNNLKRLQIDQNRLKYPPWLGHVDFHASHRAALLYKDREHYSQFGWIEKPSLKYLWPIQDEALAFKNSFVEI